MDTGARPSPGLAAWVAIGGTLGGLMTLSMLAALWYPAAVQSPGWPVVAGMRGLLMAVVALLITLISVVVHWVAAGGLATGQRWGFWLAGLLGVVWTMSCTCAVPGLVLLAGLVRGYPAAREA